MGAGVRRAPGGPRRGPRKKYDPRKRRSRRVNHALDLRRLRVSEMYARFMTQSEIARELGVSQGTVSADVAAVEEEVVARYAANLHRLRATQAARLEAKASELQGRIGELEPVKVRALAEWEASRQPAKTTRQEREVDAGAELGAGRGKVVQQVEERRGDPRYLAVYVRAVGEQRALVEAQAHLMDLRADLLGLKSPRLGEERPLGAPGAPPPTEALVLTLTGDGAWREVPPGPGSGNGDGGQKS